LESNRFEGKGKKEKTLRMEEGEKRKKD